MSRFPHQTSEPCGPTTPEQLRAFEIVSGLPIPELHGACGPSDPDSLFYYAELGGHRWDQLTCISEAPVLIPARRGLTAGIVRAIKELAVTGPVSCESVEAPSLENARRQLLPPLSSGVVVHLRSLPSEGMSSMAVRPGNRAATAFIPAEMQVKANDGLWMTTSVMPETTNMTGVQFLSLVYHPGALYTAEIVNSGLTERPVLVEALDDSREGRFRGLEDAIIGPVELNKWYPRTVFYLPFATRMRQSLACRFLLQETGYQLLHLLRWRDWTQVTPDMMRWRDLCLRKQNWERACYADKTRAEQAVDPVSEWMQVVTQPGSLLLIPPGAFVIAYSSGASVSSEGEFLPWACLPILQKVVEPPNPFLLMSMLTEAEAHILEGRAKQSEVGLLIEMIGDPTKLQIPPGGQTYRENLEGLKSQVKDIIARLSGR